MKDVALGCASGHYRCMTNTLDLDPEWGAIDLIEEVEEVFGFKITKEEADRCATVGDLYAVVLDHVPAWNAQRGKCSSSMTFYRIRRSLDPDRRLGINPRCDIPVGERPLKLFKKLSRETSLRFPSPRMTSIGMLGGLLFSAGLLAAIVALLIGSWLVSCVALMISLLGMLPMWADRGQLPAGVTTVGELVRRTAPLNARELQANGGRPADRWSILAALAAEHGSLTPAEITGETFLHRKSMKLAAA